MASLQDQLLKAGMVDAKKAKRLEKEKRKQAKKVRRGEAERDDQTKIAAQNAQAEKRENDRKSNQHHQQLAEKKAEVEAAGIILPDGMDDEAFVTLFGMGSTKARAGKEMEAIRAANMLMDHDPNGGAWINFARVLDAVKEGASFPEASKAAASGGGGGRSGRGGRRRRG